MATNAIFDQPEGTVIAVQVRSVDPPQLVAEDMEELKAQFPGKWTGEQCDSCGCTVYTIERDPKFHGDTVLAWTARCAGDEDMAKDWADMGADEAAVNATRTGCGAVYRLSFMEEEEVAF